MVEKAHSEFVEQVEDQEEPGVCFKLLVSLP
jgi:hypothetical protein